LLKQIVYNSEPSTVIQHLEGKVTVKFARKSLDIPKRNLEIRSLPSSSRRSFNLPPTMVTNPTPNVPQQSQVNPSFVGITNENIGLPRPVFHQNETEFQEPTFFEIHEDP